MTTSPSLKNICKTIAVLLFQLLTISVNSQSASTNKLLAHEISVTIDNDILFATDQYYTGGQDLNYRYQTKSTSSFFHNHDSSKTIISFRYGNKIFNPKDLSTDVTKFMDRPYCGWNYVNASVLNIKNRKAANSFVMEAGVVGAISGMGNFQQWWHKALSLYTIDGWDTQISNEFVLNMNFNHAHEFPLTKKMEIISSTGAWVGTGSNKITQELTLRLFKFNTLNESAFLNANISRTKMSKPECYVFISFEGNYVMSNIFIEGSLFNNNPSQFTTSLNPWLLTRKIGLQISENKTSFAIAFVHLSKETEFVTTHDYTTITLARRF